MIVPLSYFIEKPFQNWTREGSALIGSAMIYVDYRAPVGVIRDKLAEIVKSSKNWDGRVVNLQVTDAKEEHHRAALPDERPLRRPGLRPALRGARAAHRFLAEAPPRRRCRANARKSSFPTTQVVELRKPRRGPKRGAKPPPAGPRRASPGYVAVHVAFSRPGWLSCLGIHQPRFELPLVGRPMLKFEDDSAGKKGGLVRGSAFFHGVFWNFFGKNNRPVADQDSLRRKIACTGLGNLLTLRQHHRIGANALTSFRESATLGGRSGRLFPALSPAAGSADFVADNRESAVLRHFSVIRQGIKTYRPLPIKMLSATLGSLNTDAGFRRVIPEVSRLTTRLSV